MTGTRPSWQTPARRRSHRTIAAQRRRLGWRGSLSLAVATAILVLLIWGAIARRLAPTSNTSLTHFDAIIVLGYAQDRDGNPTPIQLARVTEAVHEYERGVAPWLILTGGVDRNRFVEAQVMARTAQAQGIPESAIFVEPEARDTIQNACYAVRIMKAHGWRSAEIVSSASHLPRTGLIFRGLPLEWRTHAAPYLGPEPAAYSNAAATFETLKTVRYLVWARQMERCEP
jgi:uncharacterized SAM-binding protein YcdF (DUF218 family)